MGRGVLKKGGGKTLLEGDLYGWALQKEAKSASGGAHRIETPGKETDTHILNHKTQSKQESRCGRRKN